MLLSHKLRHAMVLADQRSFRKAAEVLNLTQPALSRSIQSLERALDVRLFNRGRNAVELTAIGELLVDRTRNILAAVVDLEREVESMKGLRAGTLEVSLAPYPSARSGQLAVARLLGEHPEIHCHVRVAGFAIVADDVAVGRCEVGVADLSVASGRGLASEHLVNRPLFFFARPRHPLAARDRCTLDHLLHFPWAAIRAPARISAYLPADVGRAGHWDRRTGEFVPALESDVVPDFLVLAREADILAVATFTMVEQELADRQLVPLRFSEPWLRLGYGFIWRPRRALSPATLRFMEIVREIEAELDRRETALRERYF